MGPEVVDGEESRTVSGVVMDKVPLYKSPARCVGCGAILRSDRHGACTRCESFSIQEVARIAEKLMDHKFHHGIDRRTRRQVKDLADGRTLRFSKTLLALMRSKGFEAEAEDAEWVVEVFNSLGTQKTNRGKGDASEW